jgi:glycosyltransferase involved in cell wall biosynthesis
MILIDAVYINTSGGKVLLELFINYKINFINKKELFYLFDKRLNFGDNVNLDNIKYEILENTEKARKNFYVKNLNNIDKIFCFANVPPPIFISKIDVYVLFHNTLILSSPKLFSYNAKANILFYIKFLYIKIINRNNYKWIVQTPTVKNLLKLNLKVKEKNIFILPFFYDEWPKKVNKQNIINENNFLYVADGSSQKNHSTLFEAIEKLPDYLKKSLNFHFTVSNNFSFINKKIENLKKSGFNIYNYGYCSKNELESLYKKCNYMLFPSLTESFGLPLIEGAKAGCKIIASDLPYVYDIIKPYEVFNPYDSISICNSIKKVLQQKTNITTEIIITNQINELHNLILC